ncbi:MAG: purine-cytosine permease family protein [Acidimicrobiales bacterium]
MSDAAFNAHAPESVVEAHGIDLIPETERYGKPRDLFGMWMGTNLNVFYVVNGAVVISLGLSFGQAVLAMILGNLAFVTVGLTSLQGPKTGTSTFAVSRAAFGPNGGKGLSFFNWITCVGFEASGLALVALAALAIFAKAGVSSSTGLKIGIIVIAAVIQGLLPLVGHRLILAFQRKLAWASTVLFIIMAVLVASKVHLGTISKGGTWEDFTLAIALIVSGGGLSWANTGSDYSRYLPRRSSAKQIFVYTSLGGFLPAVLLEVLGAAIASVVSSASDPIGGIPKALPSWVAIPYLLFAIITLFAVNSIDLYSSGLTLQSLGIHIARWKCVAVDSVICTILCFLVIFSNSFNTYYSDFLGLLILWLAPWFAIYTVDWLLRAGRYDALALLDESSRGRYWRSGGIFLPGIAAQVLGMAAAAMWIDSAAFVGPLSSASGGSDFSVFAGLAIAGLAYWLLARSALRKENKILSDAGEPAADLVPA